MRREYFAIEILGRIGTPKALAELTRLAARGTSDRTGRRAARKLDDLVSDEEPIAPFHKK